MGSSESKDTTKGVSQAEFVEEVVCKEDELKDGEMKEVSVGDGKVLLVKDKGVFHAVSAKCTHYGAPLSKGTLCQGRIRCPWHGACFNVTTGDIEDFPGLDNLFKYEVSVHDGAVKVRADKAQLEQARRVKQTECFNIDDKSTTLIVGGGPAGLVCAQTLREEGYDGQVILLTNEKHLPYDRPKLSKALDVEPEKIALRNKDFFKTHKIDIRTGTEVTNIDTTTKTVSLKTGDPVKYEKLVIAVGTKARRLPTMPDLDNIRTLRSVDDAQYIAKNARDKHVVIIGTSFIGVETAACLADKAASVTIVDLVEAPFQLALGKEVGAAVKQLLEEKGVKFHFKNSAKEFVSEDGVLKEVVLNDDVRLQADLCVVGIGVMPATDFIKGSGVNLTDRGFIEVDKHMRTALPNVYAAGDITQFPLFMMDDAQVNVQHWQMAHQQGRVAALNIAGKNAEIRSVPFFWTVIFGKSIRYAGYGVGYDDIIIHGNPEDLKFVAYYTKGERVIAVASLNYDPIVSEVADRLLSGEGIAKADIKDKPRWE